MIWGIVVTVVATVVLTAVLAKVGPIDTPRERGMASWPTATAGGLAIIGATVLGLIVFVLVDSPPPGLGRAPWLLAAAAGIGMLGALDDLYDFPPRVKLAVQIIVALLFSGLVAHVEGLVIGPGLTLTLGIVLGVLGTTLWLVVMINAYNFMDGSDGLAAGVQSIGLFTLALANPGRPLLAFLLLSAAVANLAFLPFNHPGRRIFQGDCGALFSSFLIAGSTVLLATGPDALSSIYLGVFVAAPFLVDVFFTLARRARRGRVLFQAHNEHLYQRWARIGGQSRSAIAWSGWGLTAICAACGLWVETVYPDWSLAALVMLVGLLALGWHGLSRRLDQMDSPASA